MRKKQPPRVEWLDRTLFRSPLYFGLAVDEESFQAELTRMGIAKGDRPSFLATPHSDATVHFFTKTNSERLTGNCAIVCIGPRGERDIEQVYALLVHEAVHLWQRTKKLTGETTPGSEQEAYAIQSYAQELMVSYKDQMSAREKQGAPK